MPANTPICRISYVFLFKPKPPKKATDKPKYSALLIIEPEHMPWYREQVAAAATATYGDKGMEMLRMKKLKNPIHPGEDFPDNPHVQGKHYINVTNHTQPEVVDRHLNIVTDPKRVYSGIYVRANLTFKTFDVDGSKGVTAYLNGVQIVRDGERIDGQTSAKAAFNDGADLGPEDEADEGGSGKPAGEVEW